MRTTYMQTSIVKQVRADQTLQQEVYAFAQKYFTLNTEITHRGRESVLQQLCPGPSQPSQCTYKHTHSTLVGWHGAHPCTKLTDDEGSVLFCCHHSIPENLSG